MWEVLVEYEGYDPKKDDTLRDLAKESGGTDTGSGFNLFSGTRDIDFDFRTKANATAFCKAVKKSSLGVDPHLPQKI
jgi:hypothetical protein